MTTLIKFIRNVLYVFLLSTICIFPQVKEEKPETESLDEYLRNVKKTPEVITALVDAAQRGDDEVKAKSLEALARMGDQDAAPVFAKFIKYGSQNITAGKDASKDNSWLIRAHCAVGFARIKDKANAPLLRQSLGREKNDTVQKAMIFALGEMEDAESVPLIINLMEISRDDTLIIECVQALGKIGDKSCFLPLLKVSTGQYLPITKEEAVKALKKIKW